MNFTQYKPNPLLKNRHLQSIWPTLLRKRIAIPYERTLIAAGGNDFLAVDKWINAGHEKVAILSHGLGGNTNRTYITGMARALYEQGWDIVGWNARWCGGMKQKTPQMTHSGATADLHTVVLHALGQKQYRNAALVGFSLGANISALYLGRKDHNIPKNLTRAIVFSLPFALAQTVDELSRPSRKIYMTYLMREIRKMTLEIKQVKPELEIAKLGKINTFLEYDNRYTAPLNGFKDALDYWNQCSCGKWLENITVPTCVVNAQNDPFLGNASFAPITNPNVKQITPKHGGHCGWPSIGEKLYWHEKLACLWLDS